MNVYICEIFLKIASLSFSSSVLWIVTVCNIGHETLGLQHLKCFAQGALVSFGNNRGNLHLRSEPWDRQLEASYIFCRSSVWNTFVAGVLQEVQPLQCLLQQLHLHKWQGKGTIPNDSICFRSVQGRSVPKSFSTANTWCQLEGFLLPESLQWTLQGMECWILRVKLSLHSSRDRFFLQFANKPPAEANDCWEKVLWFAFLIWVLDQQCSWQGRLLCQTAGADKQVLAGGTRGFGLQVWKTVKQSCHDVYIHIYIYIYIYTDIQNK